MDQEDEYFSHLHIFIIKTNKNAFVIYLVLYNTLCLAFCTLFINLLMTLSIIVLNTAIYGCYPAGYSIKMFNDNVIDLPRPFREDDK